MSALHGWHPGERSIQQKLGFADKVATHYTAIQGDLPPEHAQFYETCLPFIPVTTLDEDGRPWGSIMAGKNGMKGFVRNRLYTKLDIEAETWEGDPLTDNLQLPGRGENLLIAGIGVEFPTRRRNKFAGMVSKSNQSGYDIQLELLVNEAIGNCPKYINVRDLEPRVERNINVVYNQRHLSIEDRLPDDAINFIHERDTVFLGTSYVPPPELASKYPPHVGMNHRGGLPGFVRIRNDGRTLVLPDYSGNRMMTSLGNIECTPLASLTFVDFTTGDVLYLTGSAENVVGSDANDIMPFQPAITLIHTTGMIFVREALPLRQKEGTSNIASPYSPPIRLLTEEASMSLFREDNRPTATLTKITLHSSDVATFTWESSKELQISPGQAIILDCSSFLGARQYQHMAPYNPKSVNDDRIRTWTVSSAATGPTRSFLITLRHKAGGALTTAFFTIAQKLQSMRYELLDDTRPLNLTVKIAGVTGEFTIPSLPSSSPTSTSRHFAWFAGGIGITPFLSLLHSLRMNTKEDEDVNIHLFLSSRDAKTLLPIIFSSYEGTDQLPHTDGWSPKPNPNVYLKLEVLHSTYNPATEIYVPSSVVVQQHAQRLDAAYIEAHKEDVVGKDIYVCGPEEYTEMISRAVQQIGVQPDRIRSEGFSY
ncbi:hypothetical protein D9756_009680 [Leucocoprinus leucothites]|uniref:FAD-binding FR-type domain-containing protein n=1 Tax=Leucocoprinus leucothites TaxID=201217 RepID=A0A8H5CWP7_9AGAR|nr:hypothetical protein D9756_009680 [Leucoagaricus leucothites]